MSKPITLKRTVTIKAIVTEDFKKYLKYEIDNSIKDLDAKLKVVEDQGKKLIESLKTGNGTPEQMSSVKQQVQLEKQQQQTAKDDLVGKKSDVDKLELNSEFVQGTIDGFVGVKVGDNLYQKLGGLEIIIKDGLVQDIKGEDAASE